MARRRRHRSAGLEGVAKSPEDLYQQSIECGTPFFSKGTRRWFRSRVTKVYPVHNRGTTYFVEASGGQKIGSGYIPRQYRVGLFRKCKVHILGKGRGVGRTYKTSAAANRVAKKIAAKARSER